MKNKKIRKKRTRKIVSKTPVNLAFWKCTLHKAEELEQFLLRGDERQRGCVIRVLNYLKKAEPEEFKEVNGKDWLRKFKNII